ncbi:hypothetical protein GMA5_24 [Gordonia phage GMA5]|uniref:Uncharacterized protein n=1 Tax=Gordonia phage GMA5 TaxID=1647472 RepID=A0A0K0MX72_9CAUD|nr:hypothetical protein BH786_gp24 [Gordonia phage GMA5]AKI28638.1 hypothetical protein GMA5_24 [Gordonia phage GMA5]
MKRPANWYATLCAETYWAEREPQLTRAAEHAIGYESDERDYYARIEPQLMFSSILVQVGREWRASKREASWAM